MSWPACPITVHPCVPEYLCPSRACLFRLWCNQLELAKTGSAVDPPRVVVSFTTAPSWIPQSDVIRSGGEQGWDLFSCCLLRLSLPLKPQGLNGLSVRDKKQSKRNITQNCSSPAPPFSYFLHRPVFFFFEGREWTEALQSHRLRVYTWQCCCGSRLGSFKFILVG